MSSLSPEATRVARHFDHHAVDFDTIYEANKGWARQLRDAVSRGTVVRRLDFVEDLARRLPTGRVLDVGCGSGRFCVRLAHRGWEAVGIDFADEMVALAEAHAGRAGVSQQCTFLAADFLSWEADQRFDLGLAIGVFDYVADPGPLLEKLMTLTEGRVVVSFPKLLHPLAAPRRARLGALGCPVHFYRRSQVERMAGTAAPGAVVVPFHRDYLLVSAP